MHSQIQVAIPRPLPVLTYYVPDTLNCPEAGMRVRVPLGHGSSAGIVVSVSPPASKSDDHKGYTLRPIIEIIDSKALISAELIRLISWAANYYHYPVGEALFSSLPKSLRQLKSLPKHYSWQAVSHPQVETLLKRSPRQLGLYQYLMAFDNAVSEPDIREAAGKDWKKFIQLLQEKGLVQQQAQQPPPISPFKTSSSQQHHTSKSSAICLTEEQQTCLQQAEQHIKQTQPCPILLHGVTGSGKTEIYLHLIRTQLIKGKQALVMVPEIGLTPHLLQRFQDFFPSCIIACTHSGLNDTERLQAWQDSKQHRADILIGTRSAVFSDFAELGIIIVDEEHDLSFKQQDSFRYHARDLAIMRAHWLKLPIVLGSATPSLESLCNAQQHRYYLLQLRQRPSGRLLPQREIQDVRGQDLSAGLSKQSLAAIEETLEREEQALVFLNRRGFAPLLLCLQCGWQATCQHCSAQLTYHAAQQRLVCHHCSASQNAPTRCPDCKNERLRTQGQGTERIELLLKQHFTNTPVLRIDRDSTRHKGALQKHLDTVHQEHALVLIGTQMLAKGHDFPRLTLVIILDVDQALLNPEYHSVERFGQLLTQVAGRAGRRAVRGRVILQTTQPEHPALQTLLTRGYRALAEKLLDERAQWCFPPFGFHALIRASAKQEKASLEVLNALKHQLNGQVPGVTLQGPVPAIMEKQADRYHAQLLIHAKTRQQRHACLCLITVYEKNIPNKKVVRWSIDVDPVELV